MIKLNVDQEYNISPQLYAPIVGTEPVCVTHYLDFAHMAFEDGSLAIYSQIWNKGNHAKSGKTKAALILYLQDEQVGYNNITSEISLNYGVRACGFDNQVIILSKTDRIAFYPDKGLGKAKILNIKNSVSDAQYASQSSFLRCQDGIIAVPLHNVMDSHHLAFLKIESDPWHGEWLSWPLEGEPPSSNILSLALKRYQKRTSDITPLYHKYSIEQSVVRDSRVLIYTHGGDSKWGYWHTALSEIGADAELLEHKLYENLRAYDDKKKRGKDALFTSSAKYCVLHSHYKATDDWKGKQKLLDLDTDELIELTLPRGYTKFRIVDHNGDFFWLQLEDRKKCKSRIIRCTAEYL